MTEREQASGSFSDHFINPGEHCSRHRDGRGEEEEDEDVQEREQRLLERDSCEVLDLSLPKRR